MKVKTSINITRDVRDRIVYAATIERATMSLVVSKLLNRAMSDEKLKKNENCTVKYQEKDEDESWCCLHVSFVEEDYRFATGMRYFFNHSVSSLVAYAVNKYLDKYILKILKSHNAKFSDNYEYTDYHLTKEVNTNYICWKIYWIQNSIRIAGFT